MTLDRENEAGAKAKARARPFRKRYEPDAIHSYGQLPFGLVMASAAPCDGMQNEPEGI